MDIEQLKKWLKDEMKYEHSLPDDEQLRLLSGGALQSVWTHMLRHCRSLETVAKVKGNLQVTRKKQLNRETTTASNSTISASLYDGGEREELLLERSRLISRLHETLAKIDRVKMGIKSAEEDLRNLHRNKDEYVSSVAEKRKSSALLTLYMKQVQNTIKSLNSVIEKHNDLQLKLQQKTQGDQMFSVGGSLETEGERRLRLSIDTTLNHMTNVLDNKPTQKSRSELRSDILELLSNLSASCLEKTILKNVQSQIFCVSEQRSKLDLVEEARELKLQANYDSPAGGMLSTVREEVENLFKKHRSLQEDLTRAKNKLLKNQEQLQTVLTENSENICNMKELQPELDRVDRLARLDFAQQEVENQKAMLAELSDQNSHQEVITWVNGAQANIQSMTDLIYDLIDSNTQGQTKLEKRQAVTEELLKDLPPSLARLQSCVEDAMNEPSDMLNAFLQLPVERYCSTLVQERKESTLVPTPDLTIYRPRQCFPFPSKSGDPMAVQLDGVLAGPNSRLDLCQQVSELLFQVESLRQENQNLDSQDRSSRMLSSIERLAQIYSRTKTQQLNDFQPLLLAGEECGRQGLTACGHVEAALNDFHSQATQLVVAGDLDHLVDGRTLGQWQETLRVAVANTKQ